MTHDTDTDESTCTRCHASISMRFDSDPSPECDSCAHDILDEIRGIVSAYEMFPAHRALPNLTCMVELVIASTKGLPPFGRPT